MLRDRLPLATVAGEVIGREAGGWVRSLTVNRGRGDGIAQQTPVIMPDGLVGRVVQVHRSAAVIQLLNDPASTVGAVVQRTRTAGLVEGDAGGAVRFKFMARDGASVAPGDLVVTSGLGTLFPKGLPVGRVVRIEDKGSALFHFAVLTPAVDVSRVEEVLLAHRADDPGRGGAVPVGWLAMGLRLLLLLVTVGGGVLQSTVVAARGVGGVTPDVPLILTVLIALRNGPESGCLAGFVAGLLQDATGGGLVGVQALTKGLAGFGMGLLVGRFWVTNPLVQVPGLVLLSVAEGLARFLLLQMFHYPAAFGELMLHVILPQALYNGLIGTLCILAEAGYELMRRRSWQ